MQPFSLTRKTKKDTTRKTKKETEKKNLTRSTDTSGSSGERLQKTKGDLRITSRTLLSNTGADGTAPDSILVLQHQPQEIITSTGGLTKVRTGLASDDMASWFAQEATQVEANWEKLDPGERMRALLGPANLALKKFGVPPVSDQPGWGQDPCFDRAVWGVLYPAQFADFELDHQQFARLAGSIYHEVRHAEQAFRVARKLAAEKKTADEIAKILGVTDPIAQKAVKAPLSRKQKDEWAQAEAWQQNLVGTSGGQPAGEVNGSMNAAKNEYHGSEGRWRKYLNPQATPEFQQLYDTIMQDADGPQKWAKCGEALRLKYIQDRELFKQWFTFYAMQPVEEDAWAVGGQVETLLAGKAFTAQALLAEQLSPDPRTMTPVQAPPSLEQRFLLTLLNTIESESNAPAE